MVSTVEPSFEASSLLGGADSRLAGEMHPNETVSPEKAGTYVVVLTTSCYRVLLVLFSGGLKT